MKRLRLFSLIASLVLLATPLTVLAQGDTGKTKEFTTEDGTLTVSYPENWVIQETIPPPAVRRHDSQFRRGLQKTFADDASDFATGEQAS